MLVIVEITVDSNSASSLFLSVSIVFVPASVTSPELSKVSLTVVLTAVVTVPPSSFVRDVIVSLPSKSNVPELVIVLKMFVPDVVTEASCVSVDKD